MPYVTVPVRPGERLCLRCGANPAEERRLGDFGCSAHGSRHEAHLWGRGGEGKSDG